MDKKYLSVLSPKVFTVNIGMVVNGDDNKPTEANNFSSTTVIARTADEAMKKARLRKGEFVESVVMGQTIDRM